MTKPVLRGLIIAAFFALTAFVLVPVFVPRPAFIPGFAPPPDMWPRTVSTIGIGLGLLALFLAFTRPTTAEERIETDGSSQLQMVLRFLGLVVVFGLFLGLLPHLGFLLATMLLTLTVVLLTGERQHRLWIVLLSFVAPVLLLLFFNYSLGTQFPKGVLTKPFGF
ncbi:tripartite tricarboxylate transporter TctB family protein [Tritonibacter scottomollicae]|uniref:Tripartite tricarboxylate transporter TctB family protein n=1 Tax=Tritonibacter scottomollicae TaxID=483013 RepID=A0ABZ0HDY8_TRISK|nr:tripartite tricarboxylate transporter TctB family protein [Tritonibacter scottomollicae]WOI32240.1 tripartite tricarboxylate transporter TctB family protein [Tritonibacter scottomollicae]